MSNTSDAFQRLYDIVIRLRAPGGCPWDREQTPMTMRGDLLEEAYEAVEAITDKDIPHVCEELGDVFLNTIMIAYMNEQEKGFTIEDSLNQVSDKIIRRHPHVFGTNENSNIKTAEQVLSQWDKIKSDVEGRKQKSLMDEVSSGLPPIKRAYKIQKKAAKVGFDWTTADEVWPKVEEEISEVKAAAQKDTNQNDALNIKTDQNNVLENTLDQNVHAPSLPHEKLEEEIGDLLFTVINLSRKYKIDPEQALLNSTNKFIKRFKNMEQQAKAENKELADCTMQKKESYWQKAKKSVYFDKK